MNFSIICGLVIVLLVLGLFHMYKSNKLRENLTPAPPEGEKPPTKSTAKPINTTMTTGPSAAKTPPSTQHMTSSNKGSANKLKPGENDGNSTVYNINERLITFNELLVEEPKTIPKPSSSLKCNCWPLHEPTHHPQHPHHKSPHPHHKHQHHHRAAPKQPHKQPTQGGYAEKKHARDTNTGLITDNSRPHAAETYQLSSPFH